MADSMVRRATRSAASSSTPQASSWQISSSRDRVSDDTQVLNVGDELEARITNVDRKNRVINLSVRAKDQAQDREAMDNLQNQDANAPKTIGDLIKQQMENSNES